MWFLYTISIIGLLFLVVNAILFSTNKVVKSKVSKIFICYLVSLAVIEVTCHIVGMIKNNSNFFISHFYFFFQFTFLSYFFYSIISSNNIKKLILILYPILSLFLGYTYFENPKLFWQFNTFEIVSTSLLLVVYALMFLFQNLEFKHSYFNFSIGLILYLSCSIAIFLSGNLDLVLYDKPHIDIWIFNSIFYIIFQYFIFREYLYFSKKDTNTN